MELSDVAKLRAIEDGNIKLKRLFAGTVGFGATRINFW